MKLRHYFITTLVAVCVMCSWAQKSEHSATSQSDEAKEIVNLHARVVAIGIPGASAISQVGTFLNNPVPPAHPIPTLFPSYIQSGAVLDPNRILVGSESNLGASLATGAGAEGSFLSIDPRQPFVLEIPRDFAQGGDQASALAGAVQMFSANSPHWYNGVNNPKCDHRFVCRREQPARFV